MKNFLNWLKGKKNFSTANISNRKEFINNFVKYILDHDYIGIPRYCPKIKSKEQAHKLEKQLSLIYIWGENQKTGQYCLSINGYVLREILETYYSSRNPDFNSIRDEVLMILATISPQSASTICEKSGLMPSQLFKHCNTG